MTRLAVSAALLLTTFTAHAAQAQEAPDEEIGTAAVCAHDVNGCTEHPELLDAVRSAAAEAGVNVTDLLGAVNTTGMAPRDYLVTVGDLAPPPPPTPVCGWPICGPLGHRLYCIEELESHHNGAAVNRSSGAAGWLQWLPSTARRWGVVIGDRWSEWQGAARVAAQGESFFRSQWVAVQRGC